MRATWFLEEGKHTVSSKSSAFGPIYVFDSTLTSPGNVEPHAAVSPEMNTQYLNVAYLVLSLHPVGSLRQHNHTPQQHKAIKQFVNHFEKIYVWQDIMKVLYDREPPVIFLLFTCYLSTF